MPFNVKHEAMVKKPTVKQAQRSVHTDRKAPGTRIGLMTDWRDGSAKSGKLSGRYGRSLRDGK